MIGRPRTFTDEERKERKAEYQRRYRTTKNGRASQLLGRYNESDKKGNRGKGDLTVDWIVENIFSKPCVHCGETDWHKLGCNRIDNDLPHTKNNVESCCEECNTDKEGEWLSKRLGQINMVTGEIIKTWNSTSECKKNGHDCGNISKCCNGIRKSYKRYIWKYVSN